MGNYFAQALLVHLEDGELGIFKHVCKNVGNSRRKTFRRFSHHDVSNSRLAQQFLLKLPELPIFPKLLYLRPPVCVVVPCDGSVAEISQRHTAVGKRTDRWKQVISTQHNIAGVSILHQKIGDGQGLSVIALQLFTKRFSIPEEVMRMYFSKGLNVPPQRIAGGMF